MINRIPIVFAFLMVLGEFANAPLGQESPHGEVVVNVMNFGAHGDGKTDDFSAVKQAIEKLAGSGGGSLVFPSGHAFLISQPIRLPDNTEVIGGGEIIGSFLFDREVCRDIVFRDVTIVGNGVGIDQPQGILQNCYIVNCNIAANVGMRFTNVRDTNVVFCKITGYEYGIVIRGRMSRFNLARNIFEVQSMKLALDIEAPGDCNSYFLCNTDHFHNGGSMRLRGVENLLIWQWCTEADWQGDNNISGIELIDTKNIWLEDCEATVFQGSPGPDSVFKLGGDNITGLSLIYLGDKKQIRNGEILTANGNRLFFGLGTLLAGKTVVNGSESRMFSNLGVDHLDIRQVSGDSLSMARPLRFPRDKSIPPVPAMKCSPADLGPINVKSLGAKGDGKTDDWKAIQQAFDLVATKGQSRYIYLPAGTYFIERPIVPPSGGWVLIGDGPENTVIKADPRLMPAIIDAGARYSFGPNASNSSIMPMLFSVSIRNLTFDGGRVAVLFGANTASDFFDRVTCRNHGYAGMVFYGLDNGNLFSNCKFIGGQYGIRFGVDLFRWLDKTMLMDCEFRGQTIHGIDTGPSQEVCGELPFAQMPGSGDIRWHTVYYRCKFEDIGGAGFYGGSCLGGFQECQFINCAQKVPEPYLVWSGNGNFSSGFHDLTFRYTDGPQPPYFAVLNGMSAVLTDWKCEGNTSSGAVMRNEVDRLVAILDPKIGRIERGPDTSDQLYLDTSGSGIIANQDQEPVPVGRAKSLFNLVTGKPGWAGPYMGLSMYNQHGITYPQRWLICGPFTLDTVGIGWGKELSDKMNLIIEQPFGPEIDGFEKPVQVLKSFTGDEGVKIACREWDNTQHVGVRLNRIDLGMALDRSHDVLCYAMTHFYMDEVPPNAAVSFGYLVHAKIWINGQLIHTGIDSPIEPTRNKMKAPLRKGWNQVVIKVAIAGGGATWQDYGFMIGLHNVNVVKVQATPPN